ncbi:MAG: RNB domain-containing ribonuclease, partial [Candidatus Adiutrix sp.]|nr:RNB domain-containing ribonuclease [Candidatus Adiutrix sp.]
TLTIDSNGARDLDDAVSIKSLAGGRWQVGIHITDVAAFILPDSPLDLAARRRASSIYLPEGKYPMLPGELSEGLLSLTPGDVKPAFSFLATIEKDGAVAEYDLGPSLIRVDRQFSFSEADSLLDDDSDLVELWDLAQALVARREAAGGVNLGLPKLNVFLQPDGAVCPGLANWDTPAKTIIGEIMILANHLAAEALHKNGYPCPFRVQDKTREAPPKNVPDGPDGALALALALRRRIGRGGLSFKPGPHHGLGLSVYTAFTAPMRRYLDLLVARQLRSLAEDAPPAMDEQSFMRLGLPAYELQQRIQKMQSRRLRYWLMVWLEDKVGREFSALVFEQNGRRLRVCLTDFMLEFDIFTPRDSDGGPDLLGKRIQMKLVAARKGDEAPRFEVV